MDMKSSMIIVSKDRLENLYANSANEACWVAGSFIHKTARQLGEEIYPVMIEDTKIEAEDTDAWFVRVDYYGGYQ